MLHSGGHKKRLAFGFLSFFFSLLLLLTGPVQVSSLSHFNHVVFKENNVLFWNPDEGCDTSVEIIGDSITDQAKEALRAKLPDATINFQWGRPWGDGLAILSGGTSTSILVWLLGTNNFHDAVQNKDGAGQPLTESDITSLHDSVGPNTQVILMTIYDAYGNNMENRYNGNNELIRGAAEKYENFHLFDWNSIANPGLTRFDDDDANGGSYGKFQVHLSESGIEAFASGVTSAVEEQKTDIQNFCYARFNRSTNCHTFDGVILGNDNASTVFGYLTQQGFSETAAAAILGNLHAESGINPTQLQKMTENASYNNYQTPSDFIAFKNGSKTFSGGFGIAQWTSSSRVEKLQAFANSKNQPVTSMAVQTAFLYNELTSYGITPAVLNSKDLRSATEYVLKNYEKPLNQSSEVVSDRTNYARQYIGLTPGEGNDFMCSSVSSGDASVTGEAIEIDGFILYTQCGGWGNYSSSTVCKSGCGPTSFAIIASNLLGRNITPDMAAKVAGDAGMYKPGQGSSHAITGVLAREYGLTYSQVSSSRSTAISDITSYLQKGYMIHTSGTGSAPYSAGGHYIAIVGIANNGNWIVANSAGGTLKQYPPQAVLNGMTLNNIYAVGK